MKTGNPGGMNLAFDDRKVPAGGYASVAEHRHIDQQFAEIVRHLTGDARAAKAEPRSSNL